MIIITTVVRTSVCPEVGGPFAYEYGHPHGSYIFVPSGIYDAANKLYTAVIPGISRQHIVKQTKNNGKGLASIPVADISTT